MLNQRLMPTRALLAAALCSVGLVSAGVVAKAAPTIRPAAVSGVHAASQSVSQYTIIHAFSGPDGAQPNGPLVVDNHYNIYGVGQSGGSADDGVVYTINANSNAESLLHTFTGADGIQPTDGLLNSYANIVVSKNLYGVAQVGGSVNGGTLYMTTTSGGYTLLHDFTGGADGSNPLGQPFFFTDGKLYGATFRGAASNMGVVYSYDGKNFNVLHTFTGGADGGNPATGLNGAANGNKISPYLYGTTQNGGAYGYGTIYQISPSGVLTTVHSFNYPTDGGEPAAGMVPDDNGNMFGTTSVGGSGQGGTIFEFSATTGAFQTLYAFPTNAKTGMNPKGLQPMAKLAGFSDNWIYGTTAFGGPGGGGTVFKLSHEKRLVTLHAFSGTDGQTPEGQLLLLKQGIFGTTSAGGPGLGGVVFQLPY